MRNLYEQILILQYITFVMSLDVNTCTVKEVKFNVLLVVLDDGGWGGAVLMMNLFISALILIFPLIYFHFAVKTVLQVFYAVIDLSSI